MNPMLEATDTRHPEVIWQAAQTAQSLLKLSKTMRAAGLTEDAERARQQHDHMQRWITARICNTRR